MPGVRTSGKNRGLAFSGDVEHVGRHAAAAERGQGLGNGVVIAGPVGAEQDDVVVGEGFLDFGVCRRRRAR